MIRSAETVSLRAPSVIVDGLAAWSSWTVGITDDEFCKSLLGREKLIKEVKWAEKKKPKAMKDAQIREEMAEIDEYRSIGEEDENQ